MGLRGPIPKPKADAKLAGTHRMDRSRPAKQMAGALPPPPDDLGTFALECWNRVVPLLQADGLAGPGDYNTLVSLCQVWQEAQLAQQTLDKEGRFYTTPSGQKKLHPAAKALENSIKLFMQLSNRYGLDPASRARLRLSEASDRVVDGDSYSEFLEE